jgi:putative transposase
MPDHIQPITPAEAISLERAVQFVKGGFSFRLETRLRLATEFRQPRRSWFSGLHHRAYIRTNPVHGRLSVTAGGLPVFVGRGQNSYGRHFTAG